jgi:hypothetical protein
MGEGPLEKEKSKQKGPYPKKNQDDFELAERSFSRAPSPNKKSSNRHLASLSALTIKVY